MPTDASAWIGFGFFLSELGLVVWRRARVAESTTDHDAGSLQRLWMVITLSMVAGVLLSIYGVRPSLPAGLPRSGI